MDILELPQNKYGIIASLSYASDPVNLRNIATNSELTYAGQWNRLYEHDYEVANILPSSGIFTTSENSRIYLPTGTYKIEVYFEYGQSSLQSGSFQPQVFTAGINEEDYTLCHSLPSSTISPTPLFTKQYYYKYDCVIECKEPRELGVATRWYTSSTRYSGGLYKCYINVIKGYVTNPVSENINDIGNGMPFINIPESLPANITWNTIHLSSSFLTNRQLLAYNQFMEVIDQSHTISYSRDVLNWSYNTFETHTYIKPNQTFTALAVRDYGDFVPIINYKGGSNLKVKINKRSRRLRK